MRLGAKQKGNTYSFTAFSSYFKSFQIRSTTMIYLPAKTASCKESKTLCALCGLARNKKGIPIPSQPFPPILRAFR
jgi:hypothetical protein